MAPTRKTTSTKGTQRTRSGRLVRAPDRYNPSSYSTRRAALESLLAAPEACSQATLRQPANRSRNAANPSPPQAHPPTTRPRGTPSPRIKSESTSPRSFRTASSRSRSFHTAHSNIRSPSQASPPRTRSQSRSEPPFSPPPNLPSHPARRPSPPKELIPTRRPAAPYVPRKKPLKCSPDQDPEAYPGMIFPSIELWHGVVDDSPRAIKQRDRRRLSVQREAERQGEDDKEELEKRYVQRAAWHAREVRGESEEGRARRRDEARTRSPERNQSRVRRVRSESVRQGAEAVDEMDIDEESFDEMDLD